MMPGSSHPRCRRSNYLSANGIARHVSFHHSHKPNHRYAELLRSLLEFKFIHEPLPNPKSPIQNPKSSEIGEGGHAAAIDLDALAGDVEATVGYEEADCVGDVLGLTDAAER